MRIGGTFYYNNTSSQFYIQSNIKWNMEGWLRGLNEDPNLFVPFIARMAEKIDLKDISPEDLNLIRKRFPKIFKILAKRFGEGVTTLADLGDLGF